MKVIYEHTADKNVLNAWDFYLKTYSAMSNIIGAMPTEYACHFFCKELDTDALVGFANALLMKSKFMLSDNVYIFKVKTSTEDNENRDSYCCWFALSSGHVEHAILESVKEAIDHSYDFCKKQSSLQG